MTDTATASIFQQFPFYPLSEIHFSLSFQHKELLVSLNRASKQKNKKKSIPIFPNDLLT